MPRIPRGASGANVLHLLSRGNARATVFHDDAEYSEFVELLGNARRRFDVPLYAFVVMPNHFHLVAQTASSAQLSAFMQLWLTRHVRRYHLRHRTSGHVWQGRFKSFPIQHGEHLLTVLRYVLLNPVRAGLVSQPQEWRWSSLRWPALVTGWPVQPARDTTSWLLDGLAPSELERVRESIVKRRPFGDPEWQREAAEQAGLESTLRTPADARHRRIRTRFASLPSVRMVRPAAPFARLSEDG